MPFSICRPTRTILITQRIERQEILVDLILLYNENQVSVFGFVLIYGLQHGAVVGIPFEIDYVGMQVMSNKVCDHSVVT